MILFYRAVKQLYYKTRSKPGFTWVMWHNLCQSCKRVGLGGLSTYTLAHGLQTVSFGCSWWKGTVISWNVSVQGYIFLHLSVSDSQLQYFLSLLCHAHLERQQRSSQGLVIIPFRTSVYIYIVPGSIYVKFSHHLLLHYRPAGLTFFLVRQNGTLGRTFMLPFSKEVNSGESILENLMQVVGCLAWVVVA